MIEQQDKTILIVDDDETIRNTVSRFIEKIGYQTVSAADGATGLKLFKEHKPLLAIVDVRMPVMKGLDFLKEVRKFDSLTPIIITTGYPDMNTVIEAMHHGAYDYLTKPFQLEMLQSKVTQAINALDLRNENTALTELVSLHSISNTISNTHNIPKILDVTFQFCVETLKADKASILLVDKNNNLLSIERQKGILVNSIFTRIDDTSSWPISKWVVANEKSLLIGNNIPDEIAHLPLSKLPEGYILSVPVKANEELIGVINLNRSKNHPPFTEIDRNILEVLASQAGTAINNANLYNSLKQKVSELSLICNYSQHFVGLVELSDVIKNLFETVREHFAIDVIGFLDIKKRFHEFLYWKRGDIEINTLKELISRTTDEYNSITQSGVLQKRVKPVLLDIAPANGTKIDPPFEYTQVIPLVWEDFNFGALMICAMNRIEINEEKSALMESIIRQTRTVLISAKLYSDMKENYIRTIKALAIAVDAKDTYTHGHSENVMNIAEAIALEMNVDAKTIGTIRDGGLLHDIGKIGIPGNILNKPGPLTEQEFDGVMKTHCTLGANIVKDVPFLHDLYTLILHHHENYDGSGYPAGLIREEIPLSARIVHVADAFEAMTSNRPYRDSLGKQEAVDRLLRSKGKEFDPSIIDAFIRVATKKGWLRED